MPMGIHSRGSLERARAFDHLLDAYSTTLRDPQIVEALGASTAGELLALCDRFYLPNMTGQVVTIPANLASDSIALLPISSYQANYAHNIIKPWYARANGEIVELASEVESDIHGCKLPLETLWEEIEDWEKQDGMSASPSIGNAQAVTMISYNIYPDRQAYRQATPGILIRDKYACDDMLARAASTMVHEGTHILDTEAQGILAQTRFGAAHTEINAYRNTGKVLEAYLPDDDFTGALYKQVANIHAHHADTAHPERITQPMFDELYSLDVL
jgi:hypothetical protein